MGANFVYGIHNNDVYIISAVFPKKKNNVYWYYNNKNLPISQKSRHFPSAEAHA